MPLTPLKRGIKKSLQRGDLGGYMESKLTDHSNYIGNKQILEQYKIAFLCSRKCPAEIILKSYDWAIEQREKGICVVSGFHSKIENDVLHYLLKGNQPIILALARGLKKKTRASITRSLKQKQTLAYFPIWRAC